MIDDVETRFVTIVDRARAIERLRYFVKRRLPVSLITLIAVALRPQRIVRDHLQRWVRRRRALPAPLRRPFARLWREAHSSWSAGKTIPTALPIRLPLGRQGRDLVVRPGTSDILLYEEIIVQERYGRVLLSNVHNILDCGANIGLSSAFLLEKYPNSRVVAVEPDPTNFEICRQNLAQFGDRATLLKAALWGEQTEMAVVESEFSGTWASSVSPISEDTSLQPRETVQGYDMPTLLARLGMEVVDVLKIDIEGAEAEVFHGPDLKWLDRVRCIQIELENATSESRFHEALAGRPFALFQTGDVTIAVRTDSLQLAAPEQPR